MRKRSIAVAAFLAASNLMAMPKPSLAGPICWIDHVAKADGGVDIYFMQKAMLRLGVKRKSPESSATYTVLNGVLDDEGGHDHLDHLFVRNGDEFFALQGAEDSCFYEVTANEAVGKVKVKSAMHLPGLEPLYTTQIIATDGTVSEIETSR
jgi:hypothetical protein